MKVIEITSITLEFEYYEYSPEFNKGDLICYKGDIYKVYNICSTDTKLYIKLELISRATNVFAINKPIIEITVEFLIFLKIIFKFLFSSL